MRSLVERLRATEKRTSYLSTARTAPVLKSEYDAPINPDGPEAANEIERLTATLKQIVEDGKSIHDDNARFMAQMFVDMAAKALSIHEGKPE